MIKLKELDIYSQKDLCLKAFNHKLPDEIYRLWSKKAIFGLDNCNSDALHIACAIAGDPNTPDDVFLEMSKCSNVMVRWYTIHNPLCPDEIVLKLRNDNHQLIRDEAIYQKRIREI